MTKQSGPTKERELILDILMEILENGGYSHVVLKKALDKHQYLEKQNRAFVTRVVEGTIEYLLTIDAVIDQCSKIKVKKMKPVIRTILRMSVYQILTEVPRPERFCERCTAHHFQGKGNFCFHRLVTKVFHAGLDY